MNRPVDANHALLIGEVHGALGVLSHDGHTSVEIASDDGGYLDTIIIQRRSGRYRVSVTPEEPPRAGGESARGQR